MDKLNSILDQIGTSDREWEEKAWERLKDQIRPRGSLGRIEPIAARLAGITGTFNPDLTRKIVFTMAGDHGVVSEGVSAYPQEVTGQMVFCFTQGWATINVLARHAGADVRVVDCGVASDLPPEWPIIHSKIRKGTDSITKGPAMSREEAIEGLLLGARLVIEANSKEGYRLFGTGDMGIGNTTPSTAIAAVFSGKAPAILVGRGTGLDDEGLVRKTSAIEAALKVNKADSNDPLGVLEKLGGLEIAGLAGAILGSAAAKAPVLCDGLIATAGALIACRICPQARDYLFISHRSAEPAHQTLIDLIGLEPILDLGMRLGEGTGAVLAMNIVEAAGKVLGEIKTFGEAGVSGSGE